MDNPNTHVASTWPYDDLSLGFCFIIFSVGWRIFNVLHPHVATCKNLPVHQRSAGHNAPRRRWVAWCRKWATGASLFEAAYGSLTAISIL